MSYLKQTVISGYANNEFKCLIVRGHWNIQSAIKRARNSKIEGQINIRHAVADMSGKGRGGHDGRYIVDADNNFVKKSSWSEFGVEHA